MHQRNTNPNTSRRNPGPLKHYLVSIWEEVVGIEIAKHTTPIALVNSVLFVVVNHPVWEQELWSRADQIRQLFIKTSALMCDYITFFTCQNRWALSSAKSHFVGGSLSKEQVCKYRDLQRHLPIEYDRATWIRIVDLWENCGSPTDCELSLFCSTSDTQIRESLARLSNISISVFDSRGKLAGGFSLFPSLHTVSSTTSPVLNIRLRLPEYESVLGLAESHEDKISRDHRVNESAVPLYIIPQPPMTTAEFGSPRR